MRECGCQPGDKQPLPQRAMLALVSQEMAEGFLYQGNITVFTCLFSLVSAFSQKNKTYKMGLGVCVLSFGPPLTISKPVIRLIRNLGYI